MDVTDSDYGIQDPDNVILYPAPNFMQPSNRIQERVGEIRSPPSVTVYRNNGEAVIPINRYAPSGYSREYPEKFSHGGYPQDSQISTENYVPSTGGATSPRNFSISSKWLSYDLFVISHIYSYGLLSAKCVGALTACIILLLNSCDNEKLGRSFIRIFSPLLLRY